MSSALGLALLTTVFLGSAQDVARDGDGVCDYEGTKYPVGNFRPDPCSPCVCREDGKYFCGIEDCFSPGCVDFQWVEDQCCPVCPNGPTCNDLDGNILMANETVMLPTDDGEGTWSCQCDTSRPYRVPVFMCYQAITTLD